MSRSDKEVLCEGWLTKSPPTKRIWRGRWRKRWFSLYPGDLPGQFFLAYYTDRNCRKLKGIISLDQCEQVDTGLKFEDKKFKFDFLFAVKTQPRTYYLAAETENEMKTWVKCICDVCGLKATSDDEDPHIQIIEEPLSSEMNSNISHGKPTSTTAIVQRGNVLETPPVSPVSTSPYIPISECITGKSPLLRNCGPQDLENLLRYHFQNSLESQYCNSTYNTTVAPYLNNASKFYDSPRLLHPHNSTKSNRSVEDATYQQNVNLSPLQSPTDSESVFTDDDWSHNTLSPDCDTKQSKPSDSSADMDIFSAQRLGQLTVERTKIDAPPRPPKPAHINQGPNYFNIPMASTLPKISKEIVRIVHNKSNSMCDDITGQVASDDMYDFPRSHQLESFLPNEGNPTSSMLQKRHCYNNAAPVTCPSPADGHIFRYDVSPKPSAGALPRRQPSLSSSHVFHFSDVDDATSDVVPASPSSQGSSTAYSNLPSPLLLSEAQLMPPPAVNRGLKPTRKLSDAVSVSSATSEQPLSSSSSPPPSRLYSAPSVDRRLKPSLVLLTPVGHDCGVYGNVLKRPSENNGVEEEGFVRKVRAAPSPTPSQPVPIFRRSHDGLVIISPPLSNDDNEDEQIYHFFNKDGIIKQNYHKLEYLDLDLDNISSQFVQLKNIQPMRSPGATTVYKEVDFMKTEAFNITRNNLEKQRQNQLQK